MQNDVFNLNKMVRFSPQGDFGGPGTTGHNPELGNYPAKVISEQLKDPSSGIQGAPPNFGREMVPHIFTVQGRVGTISRVYRPADEALRNSRDDARYMRNECGIMECVEARQRGTALLNWHLEPEDDKDSTQVQLCEELTAIINRMPNFLEYRRNLLEALWYGKYAVNHIWGIEKIKGRYRKIINRWSPRHGDKIVFRYDDGSWAYDPRQIGIRVGAGYQTEDKGPDFLGGRRWKIEPTDQGNAYFLDAWERDRLIAMHQHIIEDGAYEDPIQAGNVTGVGIRSRIYWTWYQMQECLAYLLDYIERSALGVEIWRFPAGNPKAEEKTREAAEQRIGGGRSIILVPVPQGEDSHLYDVQHIEPGMAGANEVRTLIEGYFAHKIKRYILGQILTSEAEATGLGSGVADAHLSTYADIIRYDAIKLGETLTTDLVKPVKSVNFPDYQDCHVKFVIDTEEDDAESKLTAWKTAFDMGLNLKASDVAGLIGASKPGPDDEVLSQQQQQPMGAMGVGMDFQQPGAPLSQESDLSQMQEEVRDDLSGYVEAPELDPENVEQFAADENPGAAWSSPSGNTFTTGGRGGPSPFTFVQESKPAYKYRVFPSGEYVVTYNGGVIKYDRQQMLWNEADHPRDNGGKFVDKGAAPGGTGQRNLFDDEGRGSFRDDDPTEVAAEPETEPEAATTETGGVPHFESLVDAELYLSKFTKESDAPRWVPGKRLNRKHAEALKAKIAREVPEAKLVVRPYKGRLDIVGWEIGEGSEGKINADKINDLLENEGYFNIRSATLRPLSVQRVKQPDGRTISVASGDVGQGSWTGSRVDIDGMKVEAAQDIAEGIQAAMAGFEDKDKFKLEDVGWSQKPRRAIAVYTRKADGSHGGIRMSKKYIKSYTQKTHDQQREDSKKKRERNKKYAESMLASAEGSERNRRHKEIVDATQRWTFAGDSPDVRGYRKAIAAHETGHAIYYQGQYKGGNVDAAWKQELASAYKADTGDSDSRLTAQHRLDVDSYRVSEYGASSKSELWAEVTSAVSVGRESDVPEPILQAFKKIREGIQ